MSAAVISPRFLTSIPAGFWPSACDIQVSTPTQDSYGEPVASWADVSGLTEIPCAKAPLSAMELQAAGYTATDQAWHVLLQGAYPAITTAHRAVVDSANFDIDAVETDQMSTVTRLRVRSVSV